MYFRCSENLLPLGVPYTFYPSVSIPWRRRPGGKYLAPHDDVLSRTLIHDVLPVGIWSGQVHEMLMPIWKTWADFNIEEATWVPYFKADPRVTTRQKDLRTSFYIGDGEIIVVVGNLTDRNIRAEVVLDRKALGLPGGKLTVTNVQTGKSESLEKSTLRFQIEAHSPRILRVQ